MSNGKDKTSSKKDYVGREKSADTVVISSYTRDICEASTERRRILQEERGKIEAALARSRKHLPH